MIRIGFFFNFFFFNNLNLKHITTLNINIGTNITYPANSYNTIKANYINK